MFQLCAAVTPPGERSMTLKMLVADRAAISFDGLPDGVTSHRRLVDTVETALRFMGVSERAITLARKLAALTHKQDWQKGNRPLVWPSNLTLRDQLGVGDRHLRRLIRELREAGALVMADSGNMKRFGRRDASGRIVPGHAFGFDLSTWATCYPLFAEIAATHKAECAARADARRTIKNAKRRIDRLVELAAADNIDLAGYGRRAAALGVEVDQLEADVAEAKSTVLTAIALRMELLRSELIGELGLHGVLKQKSCAKSVAKEQEMSARADSSVRLNNTTETPLNLESVEANRLKVVSCSGTPRPTDREKWTGQTPWDGGQLNSQQLDTSPQELAELVPEIGDRIAAAGEPVTWGSLTVATAAFASDYGINSATVSKAVRVIGWQSAHISLVVVASKSRAHFDVSPGAYFTSLIGKAEKGELDLRRSLWGLRQLRPGMAANRQSVKHCDAKPLPRSSVTLSHPVPLAQAPAIERGAAYARGSEGPSQQSLGLALAGMAAVPAVKRALAPVIQDAGRAPVTPRSADLEAFQSLVEAERMRGKQEQDAKLAAMTPAQRARHDEQERIRLAICAQHRRQSLRR
jgi:replication initiation protein RepC